jgi:crossover junction endodeoxyribonuclease RuvC
MRIIGVDPGLIFTGVGIIENIAGSAYPGQNLKFIDTELIKLPRGDLSKRLLYLHDELMKIIRETKVDVMAVEDQFFGKNAQTAFKTGQARGTAILAAARSDLPVVLLPPARVKQAVVGHGRASKEQVQHMVSQILKLSTVPKSLDCSDALAVAICHAFTPNLQPDS